MVTGDAAPLIAQIGVAQPAEGAPGHPVQRRQRALDLGGEGGALPL